MLNALDYIGNIKDGNDFVKFVSDNTGKQYMSLWKSNARANRELTMKSGWVASEYQDAHKGKTAIMLGASPAIVKQFETIRAIQNDPDFILIAVHSGLKNLLENGIHPKYCIIADADPQVLRFWEGLDMELTKNIILISNICTHPILLSMWKGSMKFIAYYTGNKDLERKLRKWYKPINGIDHFFYSLSSQYNSGTAVAFLIFGCNPIIFVGNELSFPTKDGTYYPDRKDVKDEFDKYPQIDIYGKTVYTNYGLMQLKIGLEDLLGKLSGVGWFLNCTEAGIFGITARDGNLPWIHQLKLKNGIAQARSIMRTGKPFYAS